MAAPSPMGEDHRRVDRREATALVHLQRPKARSWNPSASAWRHRGSELLRGHQLSGGAEAEPLFTVAKMSDLVVLDDHFIEARPELQEGRLGDEDIFAEL